MEQGTRLSRVQMQTLRLWLRMPEDNRSFGILNRFRNVTKTAVKKALTGAVRAGILDENYALTADGQEWFNWYILRFNAISEWFEREGVPRDEAEDAADAFLCTASDKAIEAMFNRSVLCAICKMSGCASSSGTLSLTGEALSDTFPAGSYLIGVEFRKLYHENELSMANSAFEQPGRLLIGKGTGEIQLKRVRINHLSKFTHAAVSGKMKSMEYELSGGAVKKLKIENECVRIPVEDVSWGCGESGILTGKLKVRFTCTAGPMHMPSASAVMYVRIAGKA